MTAHQDSDTTRLLHADRLGGSEHGAGHKPIHTSVQWGFERTEDLVGVFQGTLKNAYNYARQGTPTTAALEAKITLLEQGRGSISFATGMAGLTAIFLTLLRAGDHIVSSKFVFGNTNSLLGTMGDLGIAVSKVDASDIATNANCLDFAGYYPYLLDETQCGGERLKEACCVNGLESSASKKENTLLVPLLLQSLTLLACLAVFS